MIVLTTNSEGYATASLACIMGQLRWPDVAFFALNAEDTEDREICELRGIPVDQVLAAEGMGGVMLTVFGVDPDSPIELPFPDRDLTADEFASFAELLASMGADPGELSMASADYASKRPDDELAGLLDGLISELLAGGVDVDILDVDDVN